MNSQGNYRGPGADGDITTPEQVLDAAKYLGMPKDRIVQKTVPGGHRFVLWDRIPERAFAADVVR